MTPSHDLPPHDVIEAAQKLSRWFAERGIVRWQLGGCQSRDWGGTTCRLCGRPLLLGEPHVNCADMLGPSIMVAG